MIREIALLFHLPRPITHLIIILRLPDLGTIDYMSKGSLLHLLTMHGDTTMTIESEWTAVYTTLFNLYDSLALSVFWKQRSTEPVPDDKAAIVYGIVFVVNNERHVSLEPVRAEDIITDRYEMEPNHVSYEFVPIY